MEFISKIKDEHPNVAILLILLVVFVLDYFCVLQFQLKSYMSLSPQITEMSEQIQTAKNDLQRLPQYKKEIEDLKAKREAITLKVRGKEELPLILENISLLANENNVEIEQIMPDRINEEVLLENEEGEYISSPIIIEAVCGYHAFGHFMNKLEKENVLMNIPSFDVLGQDGDTKKHNIKLTINTIVFDKEL